MSAPYTVVRYQFLFFIPHELFPGHEEVVDVFQERGRLDVVYTLPQGGSAGKRLSSWEELHAFLITHRSAKPTRVDGIVELEQRLKGKKGIRTALVHYDPTEEKLKRITAVDVDLPEADEKAFLKSPEWADFKEVVDTFYEELVATARASRERHSHALPAE